MRWSQGQRFLRLRQQTAQPRPPPLRSFCRATNRMPTPLYSVPCLTLAVAAGHVFRPSSSALLYTWLPCDGETLMCPATWPNPETQ